MQESNEAAVHAMHAVGQDVLHAHLSSFPGGFVEGSGLVGLAVSQRSHHLPGQPRLERLVSRRIRYETLVCTSRNGDKGARALSALLAHNSPLSQASRLTPLPGLWESGGVHHGNRIVHVRWRLGTYIRACRLLTVCIHSCSSPTITDPHNTPVSAS